MLKPGGVLLVDEPKYRFTWEELESGIRSESMDILQVSYFFFKYFSVYLCQKPDLANNIKCGNSLIGSDFQENQQPDSFDEEQQQRVNAFEVPQAWAPSV